MHIDIPAQLRDGEINRLYLELGSFYLSIECVYLGLERLVLVLGNAQELLLCGDLILNIIQLALKLCLLIRYCLRYILGARYERSEK
jgi:hypothetical protein